MTGHFSIQFLTKPFFKKYLYAKYGNPLIFNNSDYFGRVISSVLEKNVVNSQRHEYVLRALDKFNEPVTIFLPISWIKYYRYGNGVTDDKALHINKLIEYQFEEEVAMYCKTARFFGMEVNKVLETFCERYNIEIDEDITLHNLVKIEYRYRQKINKKNPRTDNHKTLQLVMM